MGGLSGNDGQAHAVLEGTLITDTCTVVSVIVFLPKCSFSTLCFHQPDCQREHIFCNDLHFRGCRGPSKPSLQKSNFKLVISLPESDSLVTQLEIWVVVAYLALQKLLLGFG